MAFSAKLGSGLLLLFQQLLMAAHALPMKGLLEIGSGIRSVTRGTANPLVPFFKLTLVKDIFSILIDVMAVFAREPGFHMTPVREGDGGPPFAPKLFQMIQEDLFRLGLKDRGTEKHTRSNEDRQRPGPFFHTFFLQISFLN